MEHVKLTLGIDERFDELVHGGAQEMGDLKIATKDHALVGGNPGAVIAWTAVIDGKQVPVQAVITIKLLQAITAGITARYGMIE